MTLITLSRVVIHAAIVAVGVTGAATAQTADPHHPDTATSSPEAEDTGGREQGEQPGPPNMMGRTMMGSGMGGMPMMGRHGHMMKFMFAIADVDGDGALSFEEVTTVHKRIFDKVDANKDGKVTPEEMQTFMRE